MTLTSARLVGPSAQPCHVAAADIAGIITGLERAIAQAAYLVLGRPRKRTGRHAQAIEEASRLTFVGVEPGSVIEVLRLPEVGEIDGAGLPFTVSHLSTQAFRRVLSTIQDQRISTTSIWPLRLATWLPSWESASGTS